MRFFIKYHLQKNQFIKSVKNVLNKNDIKIACIYQY